MQEACSVPCFGSQTPAFAPGSSKEAVGFFCLFVSLGRRRKWQPSSILFSFFLINFILFLNFT